MKGDQLFHFGGPVVFRLPPSFLLSSLPSPHGEYRMRRVDGEGEKEQSFLTGLLFCRPVLSSSAKKKRTTHNETESSYTVYSIRKRGPSREAERAFILAFWGSLTRNKTGQGVQNSIPAGLTPPALFLSFPTSLPFFPLPSPGRARGDLGGH